MIASSYYTLVHSMGSGAAAFDTDAQAFITAASITNSTQQNAINQLVLDLKSYSLWTKMTALYPFVGGNATSHSFNLKNTSQFQLSFLGGWSHSSMGATPNGTDAYADTGLNPSTSLSLNDNHLSYYSRTNNTYSAEDIGIRASSDTRVFDIEIYWFGNSYYENMAGFNAGISRTDTRGLFLNTRTSSTGFSAYRNNTLNSIVQASVGLPNGNIFIGANNLVGTGYYHPTNRQTALISIGAGMSSTDVSNYNTAVTTYQTTLGRNV